MKPRVRIFCDGACSPNPGIGGWGVVIISTDHHARRELSGAEPESTNNRMELTAALRSLSALKRPCNVVLHTDSRYLRDAFAEGWLKRWQKNGWRTSSGKKVENQDLWRELLEQDAMHEISWRWVRGHADNVEHNRCDELAVLAREALRAQLR